MAKVSVSKLVESGTKKTAKSVSHVAKIANKSTKAAVSAVKKSTKAVSDVVSKTTKETQKGVMTISKKLDTFCDPKNIIPCITAITIIAYIVIVTPASVLDIFGTTMGKTIAMSVVLITLLFDLKLGVLVGLAAILSITLASINKELFETFSQEYDLENYEKPIDYILETPVSSCSKSKSKSNESVDDKIVEKALEQETEITKEKVLEITGLDNHLMNYGIINQNS